MDKHRVHGQHRLIGHSFSQIALFLLLAYISWTYVISSSKLAQLEVLHDRIYSSSNPNSFPHLANHCRSSKPINASEYHARQRSLADTLFSLNASAYIAEPGANAQFYGNVSTASWKLTERVLLLIIKPEVIEGETQAKITILAPHFEITRAKMLHIPSDRVDFIEWHEEANPYELASSVLPADGKIFLDAAARFFVFDGLQKALLRAHVTVPPSEVKQLRERKSAAEIELLKCANEATLLSIRAVHNKMTIGMRESEASKMMTVALKAAGLENGGCLTLFGDNAALPHGAGTDRVLGNTDFALFDCVASLHGYVSDVTRTVALPDSVIPDEHKRIWGDVKFAQTVASGAAVAGAIAQDVDIAARAALEVTGYGSYRLFHAQARTRGGAMDVIKVGHTFSNEPGVYIEGKVGVRLEDCFYIDSNGESFLLTAGVGGQALSPWDP